MSRLFLLGLSVFCCFEPPANAQKASSIAGVELRLGMARDSVLAKLAVAPDTRLKELGDDWYEVLVKTPDGWAGAGDVIFRSGTLTRVCLYMGPTHQSATGVMMALYSAVSPNSSTSSRAWAVINQGPDPPVHEIHFLFEDREVVVSSSKPAGAGIVTVQVYFPKVLAQPVARKEP